MHCTDQSLAKIRQGVPDARLWRAGHKTFSTVETPPTGSVAGIPPAGRLRVPVSNRTDSPSSPAGLCTEGS
jgi:hypothetical protein